MINVGHDLWMPYLEGLTICKTIALIYGCFHMFRWQQQSLHASLKCRFLTKHELWKIIMPSKKIPERDRTTRGAMY